MQTGIKDIVDVFMLMALIGIMFTTYYLGPEYTELQKIGMSVAAAAFGSVFGYVVYHKLGLPGRKR